MTVIDTVVTTDQVTEWATEDGDHEKFAHIVWPADKVADAYIFGTPLQALCGKRWTPTRTPDAFPVCQLCVETYENVVPGRPWHGRRT